jgi:hypothetical protein
MKFAHERYFMMIQPIKIFDHAGLARFYPSTLIAQWPPNPIWRFHDPERSTDFAKKTPQLDLRFTDLPGVQHVRTRSTS